ncbi:MAG: glycosyltransferase family 4 protein [Saprospiraceae bacterium]|nr:glycosyltransferase family 4 protein [Saprospiraceae bacterium]
MNILHVSSATSWRGGEQQLVNLMKGLDEIHITSHLLCPENSPLALHPHEEICYLHTYRKFSSFNPVTSIKLLTLVNRHHIDIVHVHDSHAHNYAVTAATLGMKCPIVVSRKVDFPTSSTSKYNHASIKAIICVSYHVKSILEPTIKDKGLLHVIHDSIDLGKRSHKTINLRKRFNIPADHCVVANISALADHKDYPTFLKTAKELDSSEQPFTFLIIGSNAGEEQNLKKLWKELNIKSQVIFTGYLLDAQLALNEIDVFLFTSKEEGLGSTLLDAMLYEVPIVSTAAGGVPEIINHNVNGLLAPIGDCKQLADHILTIRKDNDLKEKLTFNALRAVNQLSFQSMASKTLAVYQDILNN